VELARFYQNVNATVSDSSSDMTTRLRSLLDDVVQRLPDEEQFLIQGNIGFLTRSDAISIFKGSKGFPDFSMIDRVANCHVVINNKTGKIEYVMTVITDRLDRMSDSYIKGLIAHELAEMSYMVRTYRKQKPDFKKMGRKARELWSKEFLQQGAAIGSPDNLTHEANADQEAIRLGFSEEINAVRSMRQNV
jgi:hypothetical protein